MRNSNLQSMSRLQDCMKLAFRTFEFTISKTNCGKNIYLKYAPKFYGLYHKGKYNQYEAPLSPFETISVNPSRITKNTGRENASHYMNRRHSVGEFSSGTWDKQRTPFNIQSGNTLLSGHIFDETPFYRGLVQRYNHSLDWEETIIYNILREEVINGKKGWRGIKSLADIYNYLSRIDELYDSISSEGYKRQIDIAKNGDSGRVGFIDHIAHEITVDIGRQGEILFVDGKHRLAISKILNLNEIPVTVLVRHKKWMEHRDEVWKSPSKDGSWHPDLMDQN